MKSGRVSDVSEAHKEALVINNHKLIYWYIYDFIRFSDKLRDSEKHFNFDPSDWYGLVSYSLIKAVDTYDFSKGNLSTYFHRIATNDFYNERDKSGRDVHLDSNLYKEDDFYNIGELDDGYTETECDSILDELGLYDSNLCETNIYIVERLSEGKRQLDIANELGVSRQAIHKRVLKIREELSSWRGKLGGVVS